MVCKRKRDFSLVVTGLIFRDFDKLLKFLCQKFCVIVFVLEAFTIIHSSSHTKI